MVKRVWTQLTNVDHETIIACKVRADQQLALIGVKPTYPSSKYGYIVPDQNEPQAEYFKVERFTEKPSEEKAATLIEQHAMWNCGVFAFKLHYLIDILKNLNLPTSYIRFSSEILYYSTLHLKLNHHGQNRLNHSLIILESLQFCECLRKCFLVLYQ